MSFPGPTPPLNLQLANDDRFAASVGPFAPNVVNTFNPFGAQEQAASLTSGVSVGPLVILGVGGLLLAASFMKGR